MADAERGPGPGPRAPNDELENRAPNPGPRAPDPVRTAGAAPPRRWTRAVSMEHIESELSDLWREVSRAGGPKARSLMSNLIVYGEGDRAHARPEELSEVSRLHPSRVILAEYVSGANEQAEIAIHTHGEGVAQFGVEHITMTVGVRDAVPSLLRRLTIGDLPTSICWAGSTLPAAKNLQHLTPLGRQFIYDSSVWPNPLEAIQAVAPIGSKPGAEIDVADLTWRRLKPLRHAIVQAVDPTVLRRSVGNLRAVTIEAGAAQRASAWLLAGWIASRLGWQPVQHGRAESRASVTFDTPTGRTIVTIASTDDDLLHARIETDALRDTAALDMTQSKDEIVVTYGWDIPPLSIMAPRRSRAEMMAAELRNLYVDHYLREALMVVARIETLAS